MLSSETIANKTCHANEALQKFVEELHTDVERMASMGRTSYRVEFKTDKEKEQFYPIIKEMILAGGYEIDYDHIMDKSAIEFNWNRAVALYLLK